MSTFNLKIITIKNHLRLIYNLSRKNKNSKILYWIFLDSNRIRNYKFGRLGNIKVIENYLVICDEMGKRIFFYNLQNRQFFIIEDKFDEDFQPFTICKIKKSLLVTGGKNHFYLIDLNSKKLLCKNKINGEIHGLESKFDSRGFLLLDRLNSKINEYIVNYDE